MTSRDARRAKVRTGQQRSARKAARRRARLAGATSATVATAALTLSPLAPAIGDPTPRPVTAIVADIAPGSAAGDPQDLTRVGDTLYFTADDGVHGRELWKSTDGVAGAVLVKDIYDGTTYGDTQTWPKHLTAVGDTLFFTAFDKTHHRELWKSDGTEAGTVLVKDISSATDFYAPAPQNLTAVGSSLFFTADDGTHGPALWKSDGSEAGTVLVKDIDSRTPGSYDVHGDAELTALTAVGDRVFFDASDATHGTELWTSDGTAAGTSLVKELVPGTETSVYDGAPRYLTADGSGLFFTVNDGVHGYELWHTDGTEAGTALVKDVDPGGTGSFPDYLTMIGDDLFFTADDGAHGSEIWRSDGTTAGTALVKEIYPGADNTITIPPAEGSYDPPREISVRPNSLTAVGDQLFFTGYDDAHGREVWKSDGTAAGTAMVRDIDPVALDTPYGATTPFYLTAGATTLFFTEYDGVHGRELWSSDGTAAGTLMVADINPSTSKSYLDSPEDMTVVGDSLFFTAVDGLHGRELWRTGATPVPDTTPPDTTITSGPAAGARLTTTSATFRFAGTPGDTEKFQCSLDGAAFVTCSSPHTFTGLTNGTHTVKVRAVDLVGNADPSPASRSFSVLSNTFSRPAPGAANTKSGAVAVGVSLPGPGKLQVVPGTRYVRGGAFVIRRAGKTTVVVSPSRAGLKLLKKRLKAAKRKGHKVATLPVKVTFVYTPTGGSARRMTTTYTLTLK